MDNTRLRNTVLWLWQFPQHLLALVLWGLLRLSGKITGIEHRDGKRLITVDVPGWKSFNS